MSRRVPPPPPTLQQQRHSSANAHYSLPPPPPLPPTTPALPISFAKNELSFIKNPPEEICIECPICLSVMLTSSSLTSCCGHHFCSSCISRVKGACPHCREKSYQTMPDKDRIRIIQGLKVACSNHEAGCSWEGELKDLCSHIDRDTREGECQFETVQCCYPQCGVKKIRKELDDHESNECPYRPHKCQYCSVSYPRAVSSEHYESCIKYPIACPNGCEVILPREDLSAHLLTCSLQPVDCELQWAGCTVRPLRKDVRQHLVDNLHEHFSLLAVACGVLKEENKELRNEINKLNISEV